MMYGAEKYFTVEEAKRQMERRRKAEAVSCELFKICEEKGLTIAEMLELARIFPHQVKDKIQTIEQKTGFTVDHDQNQQGGQDEKD